MKEQRKAWVLVNPDNRHYYDWQAKEQIAWSAKKWSVDVTETTETQDTGFGQEKLFVFLGESENINELQMELDDILW